MVTRALFERLDRLPQVGDTIALGDYLFCVEELARRRITWLRVESKGGKEGV